MVNGRRRLPARGVQIPRNVCSASNSSRSRQFRLSALRELCTSCTMTGGSYRCNPPGMNVKIVKNKHLPTPAIPKHSISMNQRISSFLLLVRHFFAKGPQSAVWRTPWGNKVRGNRTHQVSLYYTKYSLMQGPESPIAVCVNRVMCKCRSDSSIRRPMLTLELTTRPSLAHNDKPQREFQYLSRHLCKTYLYICPLALHVDQESRSEDGNHHTYYKTQDSHP